jgi:hypothetical protein
MRSVLLDDRDAVAVFELLIAVDTNVEAGCHGSSSTERMYHYLASRAVPLSNRV